MGLFGKKNKEKGKIITCFVCQHEWEFNDSNIPEGATYEVKCPKCGMLLKKKKITETK